MGEEQSFGINILNFSRDSKFDDMEEKILSPLFCLRELETKWLLEFDLPLVEKKDIDVCLHSSNVITVKAKLKETYCYSHLGCEQQFKYFKKSLTLPGNIDGEKIYGSFQNGRLAIHIPKLFGGKKIKVD